jgi:DNA-binding winged helix-turn-helix (wHTH) protein
MLSRATGQVTFGEFQMDVAERLLIRSGVPVAITPKAFDILALMVEQPGKLRTKQELLDALWPGIAIEEATLGRHISDLRRALGSGTQYIETVSRHGYRFVADVRAPGFARPSTSDRSGVDASAAAVSASEAARPRVRFFFAVLVALAALALGYGGIRLARRHSTALPAHNLVRLTNNVASDRGPDWSPDGSQIAFVSNRDGLPAIWVMRADGSNPRNLTHDLGRSDSPAWSPDGARIALQRRRVSQSEITVMRADGSDPRGLGVFGARAAWSPDSAKIVFQCGDSAGVVQVCVVAADGSNFRILTRLPDFSGDPSWSPDGQSIIFTHLAEGHQAIWRMDASGQNAAPLLGGAVDNNTGVWSPDGAHIAFVSDRAGEDQIYVMDAAGGDVRAVTFGPGRAAEPAWSHDGTRIVFETDRDGNSEIYAASVKFGRRVQDAGFVDGDKRR